MLAADSVDAKVALIQALIPLGLKVVAEELQAEVTRLAGPKHSARVGCLATSVGVANRAPCTSPTRSSRSPTLDSFACNLARYLRDEWGLTLMIVPEKIEHGDWVEVCVGDPRGSGLGEAMAAKAPSREGNASEIRKHLAPVGGMECPGPHGRDLVDCRAGRDQLGGVLERIGVGLNVPEPLRRTKSLGRRHC